MKKLLIGFSLMLAGCSHTEPGIEIRTVEVPTPVPCVDREDLPEETQPSELTGNAVRDTLLLKAETIELRVENGFLRALIDPACLKVEPQE